MIGYPPECWLDPDDEDDDADLAERDRYEDLMMEIEREREAE